MPRRRHAIVTYIRLCRDIDAISFAAAFAAAAADAAAAAYAICYLICC